LLFRKSKIKIDYNLKTRTKGKSKLKRKNNGFVYVDNEEYYIYRKKNTHGERL